MTHLSLAGPDSGHVSVNQIFVTMILFFTCILYILHLSRDESNDTAFKRIPYANESPNWHLIGCGPNLASAYFHFVSDESLYNVSYLC